MARSKGNCVTPTATTTGKPCGKCAELGRLCAMHRDHDANETAGTPRCGGKSRLDGHPCRQPAGYRTNHPGHGRCYRHGGGSPNGVKYGRRLMAEKAVATYGLPTDTNPHDALLGEVRRTAGHVGWLEARIHELEPDALARGVASQTTETGTTNRSAVDLARVEESALVSVWLKLYQEERRHLVQVCKTAIACGIVERAVRIAEEQGRIIAQVLSAALGDLGVSLDDQAVRLAVRRHLMLASGEVDVAR